MQFISKLLGKGSAMPIEPVLGQTATEHEPIDDRPTTVSTAINEEHRLAACRTFPLAGRIAHRSWNLTV
jgi:hypothetical protein